jgi:mRNA interferase MazF
VVPVTSNIARVLPFQVLLPADATGLDHDSKAQAEQVRTIAVTRIGWPIGGVSSELVGAIDDALRLNLSL